MVWLSIEDSNTFRNSGTWQISIMDPFFEVDEETRKASICDNVFCQFPDAISYEDYDCINEGLFLSERSFFQ